MTLTVDVTADDIAAGTPSQTACPIARALTRSGRKGGGNATSAAVRPQSVRIIRNQKVWEATLPDEAADFVELFDRERDAKDFLRPFKFDLDFRPALGVWRDA